MAAHGYRYRERRQSPNPRNPVHHTGAAPTPPTEPLSYKPPL